MEKFIRANASRLQPYFDQSPHLVRSILTSVRGWALARNRYSFRTFDFLRELRTHEKWTAECVAANQLQRLKQIVEYARESVPFYADYPQLNWKSSEELCQLPVLTREVVILNANRLVSSHVPLKDRIFVTTTGTTGASLQVAFSLAVARRNWAFRMRQWGWAKVEPRSPRITLFGSRIVPPDRKKPPYWVHNLSERQTLLSIFHLSAGTASDYITFLRQSQGQVLEGFPSVLGIVADFILKHGEPIPMRAVFTDGEPLYPFLRTRIESAFQTPIFDHYGNTEFCGLIQECEHHQMHLPPDYAYLEILDEDLNPVPPGKEGFLVWTGFINDTMPLIRYRIGDRGSWEISHSCPCGRAFPLVVPTITRESDLLHCPDGRIFSPRALNQLIKKASAFRFCQLVQTLPTRVVVRAVPSTEQAFEQISIIRSELQALLGQDMEVAFELTETPLTRAGGKIPLIVNQVKR